jgi:hypothetical protein
LKAGDVTLLLDCYPKGTGRFFEAASLLRSPRSIVLERAASVIGGLGAHLSGSLSCPRLLDRGVRTCCSASDVCAAITADPLRCHDPRPRGNNRPPENPRGYRRADGAGNPMADGTTPTQFVPCPSP